MHYAGRGGEVRVLCFGDSAQGRRGIPGYDGRRQEDVSSSVPYLEHRLARAHQDLI